MRIPERFRSAILAGMLFLVFPLFTVAQVKLPPLGGGFEFWWQCGRPSAVLVGFQPAGQVFTGALCRLTGDGFEEKKLKLCINTI